MDAFVNSCRSDHLCIRRTEECKNKDSKGYPCDVIFLMFIVLRFKFTFSFHMSLINFQLIYSENKWLTLSDEDFQRLTSQDNLFVELENRVKLEKRVSVFHLATQSVCQNR